MIDHPEKTPRLLAALSGALPFKVELVPSFVNYLRVQRIAAGEQVEQTVSDISYAGDDTCCVNDPSPGAAIYAARCGSRRLSQAPGKEDQEAGAQLHWRISANARFSIKR